MPLFVSPRRIFMKIPLKDPESGEEAQTRGRPARDRGLPLPRVAFAADDDDVYYYIRWRLKLEGETENMGVCTVRQRGMGTGISEASKRVPIFSFATQRGKQVSSHFRQGN